MTKIKVATVSLAGCFGCHMSLLDIDEKVIDLFQKIELTRSPLIDVKHDMPSQITDVGIIEGGVCNQENIEVLKNFRASCKILVAMGACAINGGIPAYRNHYPVSECLQTVYDPVPNDPILPLLLDKVRPIHEIVEIDYFLPGCPPSAEAIWALLNELIT